MPSGLKEQCDQKQEPKIDTNPMVALSHSPPAAAAASASLPVVDRVKEKLLFNGSFITAVGFSPKPIETKKVKGHVPVAIFKSANNVPIICPMKNPMAIIKKNANLFLPYFLDSTFRGLIRYNRRLYENSRYEDVLYVQKPLNLAKDRTIAYQHHISNKAFTDKLLGYLNASDIKHSHKKVSDLQSTTTIILPESVNEIITILNGLLEKGLIEEDYYVSKIDEICTMELEIPVMSGKLTIQKLFTSEKQYREFYETYMRTNNHDTSVEDTPSLTMPAKVPTTLKEAKQFLAQAEAELNVVREITDKLGLLNPLQTETSAAEAALGEAVSNKTMEATNTKKKKMDLFRDTENKVAAAKETLLSLMEAAARSSPGKMFKEECIEPEDEPPSRSNQRPLS